MNYADTIRGLTLIRAKLEPCPNAINEILDNAIIAVTKMSTVVYCKDCKYKYNNPDEQSWCYWVDTNMDDYCSLGERKTDDERTGNGNN